MRILFEVTHPAHVHCFKNIIWDLRNRNHEVLIAAKDKEVTLKLLDVYKLDYKIIGVNQKGMIKKAFGLLKTDYKLYKICKIFKPDVIVGRGSPSLANLSLLINKPYIALIDTETAHLVGLLSSPFASAICASTSFQGKIDPKKEVRFDGYKELAYLHPSRFEPDPNVLNYLNLVKGNSFVILRFVSWGATHDLGEHGFSDKNEVVKELEKHCAVFITSEVDLPDDLEKYRINAPPELMHHLLYYADLFIGESATMATESAVLGTPAIFVSTSKLGSITELETKYNLLYTFSDVETCQKEALDKAVEILRNKNTKKEWQRKRKNLLDDKIDVTEFMVKFIENFELTH